MEEEKDRVLYLFNLCLARAVLVIFLCYLLTCCFLPPSFPLSLSFFCQVPRLCLEAAAMYTSLTPCGVCTIHLGPGNMAAFRTENSLPELVASPADPGSKGLGESFVPWKIVYLCLSTRWQAWTAGVPTSFASSRLRLQL